MLCSFLFFALALEGCCFDLFTFDFMGEEGFRGEVLMVGGTDAFALEDIGVGQLGQAN